MVLIKYFHGNKLLLALGIKTGTFRSKMNTNMGTGHVFEDFAGGATYLSCMGI